MRPLYSGVLGSLSNCLAKLFKFNEDTILFLGSSSLAEKCAYCKLGEINARLDVGWK